MEIAFENGTKKKKNNQSNGNSFKAVTEAIVGIYNVNE